MSLEKKIRNFLQGPRKGETFELKNGLVSQYKHERKDAIQRVIQAMTVGKDVSALFPDVLKNIATYDIEQKKLVYLYLMNYAKTHPELCILAVNTFVQDTEDPNPLIRALAIRTMGCIRVLKMVDYMEIPLSRTLNDDNPYVRKTAALCVAKLFDLNPEMCIEYGFLENLKKLINDLNPMVVANALLALYEIRDMKEQIPGLEDLDVFTTNETVIKNLLLCLNECTEWGRITILTTLNDYHTDNQEELIHIIERIVPQLQHVNPSVVLSSIKAIIHHLDALTNQEMKESILRKLSAPLVSLVSNSIPEAQYVGLKNIRIILEKYPTVLSKELRVFFIKYSDPLYLKLEKLEIMIRLSNDLNVKLLLGELKEYAMEFEPSLVSKAIKCIGSVAIKLQLCTVKSVNLLCTLIDQRGGDLIINESLGVLINILRRYPGKNDLITLIVPVISNHINGIEDNNETLSGYIWCLGEYPKYFQNTETLENLTLFVDDFLNYDSTIQLNLLNTIVKINLTNNSAYSNLLQKVLELATQGCENADVRDKAYIYWRLLSSDDTASQQKIILHKLPPINTTISSFNPNVLELLIDELSTVSSVYHKPASTFIDKNAYSRPNGASISSGGKAKGSSNGGKAGIEDLKTIAKQEIINNAKNENLLDFDDDETDDSSSFNTNGGSNGGRTSVLDDLNDLFAAIPQQQQDQQKQQPLNIPKGNNSDILSLFDQQPAQPSSKPANKPSGSVNNDLLDLF